MCVCVLCSPSDLLSLPNHVYLYNFWYQDAENYKITCLLEHSHACLWAGRLCHVNFEGTHSTGAVLVGLRLPPRPMTTKCVCVCTCLCMMEVGGSGVGLTTCIVTHDLCTDK